MAASNRKRTGKIGLNGSRIRIGEKSVGMQVPEENIIDLKKMD